MNKISKFLVTILSAIALAFASISTSFAKVEGEYIVLGAAVSLTGKYSTNGKHTQNGYNLAVERINSKGGVTVGGKSYKFEIIYYDDESNSKRAAQLAERLIKQDGIKYMLGPYSSGLTKAMAPVTEENKIPMVEANGASRSLFTKGYKYLFAVLSPANQYLEVAIDLAVEKNGGKPVKIAIAFRQISEMKVDVPKLAMTHSDASKLAKQHGKKSEYALCAAQWHKTLSYKDKFFGNGKKYDKDFTKEYGYAPPYQAAESSAALLVYKDAFERANSFDTEKLRNALAKTDMQTFYGNIKFGSGGQNTAKPMALFQVRCKGDTCENKVVAPTKWASAKLVHPIPSWSKR